MANAIVALGNLTLGSSQATVTFSSIPATYRDLRLVWSARTNTGGASQLQMNSDSGNNYNYIVAQGSGSVAASNATSNVANIYLGESSASATEYAVITLDVMDYSATDKHKTVLIRNNYASAWVQMIAGRYASTSAITSLTLSNSSSIQFQAGSTFSLYGIVSA